MKSIKARIFRISNYENSNEAAHTQPHMSFRNSRMLHRFFQQTGLRFKPSRRSFTMRMPDLLNQSIGLFCLTPTTIIYFQNSNSCETKADKQSL